MPLASRLAAFPSIPHRARRALLPALVGSALSTVGACTKKDFKSEMDRVESWTATTHLAADRRLNGATNAAVTLQLAHRAMRAAAEAERSFSTLVKNDSERAAARGALDSLRRGIVQLERVDR
jgi:hypothetical protein